MTFISYAQNGEDVILWRALGDISEGFYIDVGAQDPQGHSVTKAFYERGWRGINVEPSQAWFERLCCERPEDINLAVCCAASDGLVTYYEIAGTGLSTIMPDLAEAHRRQGRDVEAKTVPALRLEEICARRGGGLIHFLKIDVEGAERAVLEGIDLERIRPWIIVMETTESETGRPIDASYTAHPLNHRYSLAYFDGLNSYFVAEEHASLAGRLALQPNPCDAFERHDDRMLRERVTKLTEHQEKRAGELVQRNAEIDRLKGERDRWRSAAQQTVDDRLASLQTTELLQAALAELKRTEDNPAVRLLWCLGLFAPMRLPGQPRSKKPRFLRIVDGLTRRVTKFGKKLTKKKRKKQKRKAAKGKMVTAAPAMRLSAIEPPPSLSTEARRAFYAIAPSSKSSRD